ncbi:MAG: sigma-54-dependent Fis family transcriptional regulator [Candidatus Cloacimonetes bacterium]|nr:sigma-54-dependent Fis family transcriptional regulator [Candidatus Cloacimonadota bacterium]
MKTILVVDDNKNMQIILKNILSDEGYQITSFGNGKSVLKELEKNIPDLILLDIRLPEMNGIDVLRKIKKIKEGLLVIMITAYGDIKTAVEAMKLGAYDYITKPFVNEDIILTVKKALETQELRGEVESLRKKLKDKTEIVKTMGKSPEITKVLKQVELIAPTDMSVIIQGKSGTGKEVIANLIHQKSDRKSSPFIPIDCGAIPDTLVESELFGYEKGAFTGATANKRGKFEVASEGTLLLDEVANLPPAAQAKLLRVLQEKKIQRVGSTKPINIDVRIIVATNLNLSDAVKEGKFRDDLFHRLNEFKIVLPLLRERKDDIPVLAEQFLKESNIELKKDIQGFTKEALKLLLAYSWPGNVRELKHVVKRAVLLEENDNITPEVLKLEITPQPTSYKESLDNYFQMIFKEGFTLSAITSKVSNEMEREIIKKILVKVKYNKSKAARILGIDRNTLYSKLKNLGIE